MAPWLVPLTAPSHPNQAHARARRDVYGIGMKTLVADADERHGRAVAETAAPFLLRGLGPGAAADVRGEALDLATELVRRFGGLPEVAARLHAPLLGAFIAQLAGPTPLIRKRAAAAIGALAPVLSDSLLESLVSALLAGIEGGGGRAGAAAARSELAVSAAAASARTLIQCTCTVARHVSPRCGARGVGRARTARPPPFPLQVGSRLGRHLPRVVPILLGQLGSPDDEALANEAGAELRDNCLSAFESILPHCASRAAPFVPSIAAAAQTFANFDPNYAYGGDDDEDAGGDGGDDEDDDAGGYGDEVRLVLTVTRSLVDLCIPPPPSPLPRMTLRGRSAGPPCASCTLSSRLGAAVAARRSSRRSAPSSSAACASARRLCASRPSRLSRRSCRRLLPRRLAGGSRARAQLQISLRPSALHRSELTARLQQTRGRARATLAPPSVSSSTLRRSASAPRRWFRTMPCTLQQPAAPAPPPPVPPTLTWLRRVSCQLQRLRRSLRPARAS